MIERYIHIEISYFVNKIIEPTPENISKLLPVLGKWDLIPTTVSEIELNKIQQAPTLALQFFSPKNNIFIDFERHRFCIKQLLGSGSDRIVCDKFLGDAIDMLKEILKLYPCQSNRLSYIERTICKEMNDEELIKIYGIVFNPQIVSFKDTPREWVTRQVYRENIIINGKKYEDLNVVFDINRAKGYMNDGKTSIPFDRIQIGLDINTYQGNLDIRFDIDDMSSFLDSAKVIAENTKNNVEKIYDRI